MPPKCVPSMIRVGSGGESVVPWRVLLTAILSLAVVTPAAAVAPGTDAFQRTWARTDQPVADSTVNRTWMWGPEPLTVAFNERYDDSPGKSRKVQYFDKARMEITHPDRPDDGVWY